MIRLAHKIQLKPNNQAQTYFKKASGTARFAYNWALQQWKSQYQAGLKPSAYGLSKELNAIKGTEFPWMLEVTKWAPQKAILDLGNAFEKFFKKEAKYPKFKKKGKTKDSFYLNANHIKVEGKKLWVPELGWVKMAQEVRFPGKTKSVTISKDTDDRWYAAFSVEIDESQWTYPHLCKCKNHAQAAVGIDLGIKSFAVLSDTHEVIENPRHFLKLQRKLRKAQKKLSRSVKGSKNYGKAKLAVAKIHFRIKSARRDFLHKLSSRVVGEFRWIGIEDLHILGMLKNKKLAKHIQDAGWGEFGRELKYKGKLSGSSVVEADRWFPSSKLCSTPDCGYVYKELTLGIRFWTCPFCGKRHDRDGNSSDNLKEVALGYKETLNACGEGSSGLIEVDGVKLLSVKQESGKRATLVVTLEVPTAKAALFLKHRAIAQDLQRKWIEEGVGEEESYCCALSGCFPEEEQEG